MSVTGWIRKAAKDSFVGIVTFLCMVWLVVLATVVGIIFGTGLWCVFKWLRGM